jgi:glycine dehydrogenase subunit 1
MPYIANTDADREAMLATIGVDSMEALWSAAGISQPRPALDSIPVGRSEYEVTSTLAGLANRNAAHLTYFLGGGFYDHIIPAAVGEITGRGEFYTSYTPYQPEASQGTLQAMYEYQSAICRVTAMEVANASLYDGGTALFEAMMMAIRHTRRRKAVVAATVSPIYWEMIRCYSQNLDIEVVRQPTAGSGDTATDMAALCDLLDDDTACVIAQYPNFFGTVEDWRTVTDAAHACGGLAVCSAYATALSVLTPPGELGFDVVTGEGQCLGINLSFGGPYLGFMAAKQPLMRKMPGRIVGRTTDGNGKPGFVLTLQAREQHIRRERATSNICTNEGLCALAAVVYLSVVGRHGFRRVGELCAAKAAYTREQLLAINGVTAVDQPGFFNEFVVRLPIDAGELCGRMIEKGYAAGFPLGRYFDDRRHDLLVAVTEKRTREEIRAFAVAMEAVLA